MSKQSKLAKPKTRNISHKFTPNCALRNLAGFAEFAQICGTTPTRNRDAFGRRIETIEYLGDHTRNLYDGFSFDIAEKTVLQTHAAATMPEQKYRAGGAGANSSHPEPGSGSASTGRSGAGVANGTRYRYIGDEPLENAGSAGAGNAGANAGTTAAAKTRSRPNSEYVLYAQGEPVAVNADGDTSYFGTDILGSVRSVTDKYGAVKAQYEYDAFGTPYLANLENDVGFGYTGKIFDSATGLYDYGFRDYSPNSARFTTVDPVRDGSNWFSYVVNDPVNYIDPFGLTSTDAGNGSKNSLWINNGDGTYTAKPGATLWGLQQETGVSWQSFEGYDGAPESMPVGTTVTVSKPAGSANSAVATGSAIAVATPSNNGSNNVSTNTTNGGSFGSAPIGGGAGNVSMGGGSSGSSFASVGMNTGGQNTTAQAATPTIVNTTTFIKAGAIFYEGMSIYQSSRFNATSVIKNQYISTFVSGFYAGANTVDSYNFTGTVALIIDNKEVERKSLICPDYDYLGLTEPFVTVGEVKFETKISEDSSITLEYDMFLAVKQLEGQKVFHYKKEIITIK